MNPTFEWLRTALARDYKLDSDQLMPDTALEDIGVDSLAVAELLFNVEDAFKITFPSDQVALITLGDVGAYIDTIIASQHGEKNKFATAPVSCAKL